MAATATDTVPLGVLDVLAAHRVPLTVAGALAMLEALRGSVTLSLDGKGDESLATLDSSDGASRHGLVYRFNLKPC